MRWVAAAVSITIGIGMGILGLLFLVGYGGQLHRLVVGGVGLLLAGLLVGVGVLLWKQASARTPEQVRKDILSLASKRGAVLTEADVVAAFPDRAERSVNTLKEMVRAGICHPRIADGIKRYEFPQLQGTVVVRRCSHCGWEAPLSSPITLCDLCGAPIVSSRGADDGIGLDG